MLKRKSFLVFFFGILLIAGGCNNGDKVREEVELPSGEKIERVRVSPEAEEVNQVVETIYRGRVELLPAPGSEVLPPEQRTEIVAIMADEEMIIPVGTLVNKLQAEAVDKEVVFRGVLQREPASYGGEYHKQVEVTEIVNIESE